MNPTFIIVGAGSLAGSDLPLEKKPGDFVCAADAGYLALSEAGIRPDLVVGDFDSMPERVLSEGIGTDPKSVSGSCKNPGAGAEFSAPLPEIIRLPVEKDDTDTVFCVREGFRRGYQDFLILGALGGSRLSHSIANLQLLSMIRDLGGTAVIRYGKTEVFLLGEGEEKSFPESASGSLSVFSLSEESVITLSGLYYPLDRGTLTRRFPLGVSNHFTGSPAKVTVHSGELLVITEK